MKIIARFINLILLLSVVYVGSASAHHGPGQYTTAESIFLTGVVTKQRFVNPHGYVYLDVETESGEIVPWRCEIRGAGVLRRSGWSQDLLKPGTKITIEGTPGVADDNSCYLMYVTLPDGRKLERYQRFDKDGNMLGEINELELARQFERPARLASGKPNLNGNWGYPQMILVGEDARVTNMFRAIFSNPVDLSHGMPFMGSPESLGISLTEAGKTAAEGFNAATDRRAYTCEAGNILMDWIAGTEVNRIIQDDDKIVLNYGNLKLDRTIYLDMSEHPENIELSLEGHSIGRWEGDILVVDTVGFRPNILRPSFGGVNVMSSDQMHVVERFTYNADENSLTRAFSVEDPLYFTGQWEAEDVLYITDVAFEISECSDLKYEHLNPTGVADQDLPSLIESARPSD
ncbi:MAG: DUF6152 family protein [Gammaproteobacteria bacterium]